MKARQQIKWVFLSFIAMMAIGLAGCANADKRPAEPKIAAPADSDAAAKTAGNRTVEAPATPAPDVPDTVHNPEGAAPASPEASSAEEAAVDARPDSVPTAPTAPAVETASNKPPDVKPGTGKTATPTLSLMGLRIGDRQEAAVKKHGQPLDEYTMEDGDDTLIVYDYKGFSIGFRSDGKVEFVTVQSADADPGLNGLKIGSPTRDARKLLGEPDGNTSFVLTYKEGGAVLKLDVDPKKDIIHSIKLFKAG